MEDTEVVAVTGKTTKLHAATSATQYVGNPYGVNVYGPSAQMLVPGTTRYGDNPYALGGGINFSVPQNHQDEIRQCRYFYRTDPIASTVINRMIDLAITSIRNRREFCNDEEMAYYNAVSKLIYPILQTLALEYLIAGMAVPDYGLQRQMGNRLNSKLGRKRYIFPSPLWVRNNDTIVLKRQPTSNDRSVYVKVPQDERYFIEHEGKRPDGSVDKAAYEALVKQFPEYVRRVKAGEDLILLENTRPILRFPLPNDDWPQPFLVPALAALKHKLRIKQMDFSIASKALEAIRQVKAGDKDFPITDDDTTLEEIRQQMTARGPGGTGDSIYTLYTNHTVEIEWKYPPLEALLSDAKYAEPNEEIFMAMGFSRVLLVGEAYRSNAGQSVTTTLGPVASLNTMRDQIILWVRRLYSRLADLNDFKNIPEPRFQPIVSADVVALVQFALEAGKMGVLSKNTIAQMFNTDFETESQQIEAETDATSDPKLFDVVYNKPEPEPAAPSGGSTGE